MSFSQSSLLKGERVIYTTNPHWIVFSQSLFYFMVAMFCFCNFLGLVQFNFQLYGYRLNNLLGMIVLAFSLLSAIQAFIIFRASEYTVTDKRVLMKTGLIQRYSLELFLDKIEGLHVDQTICGRIFSYGTIIVVGTGSSRDLFTNVPAPLDFRREVQQQIDRYVNRVDV